MRTDLAIKLTNKSPFIIIDNIKKLMSEDIYDYPVHMKTVEGVDKDTKLCAVHSALKTINTKDEQINMFSGYISRKAVQDIEKPVYSDIVIFKLDHNSKVKGLTETDTLAIVNEIFLNLNMDVVGSEGNKSTPSRKDGYLLVKAGSNKIQIIRDDSPLETITRKYLGFCETLRMNDILYNLRCSAVVNIEATKLDAVNNSIKTFDKSFDKSIIYGDILLVKVSNKDFKKRILEKFTGEDIDLLERHIMKPAGLVLND